MRIGDSFSISGHKSGQAWRREDGKIWHKTMTNRLHQHTYYTRTDNQNFDPYSKWESSIITGLDLVLHHGRWHHQHLAPSKPGTWESIIKTSPKRTENQDGRNTIVIYDILHGTTTFFKKTPAMENSKKIFILKTMTFCFSSSSIQLTIPPCQAPYSIF